MRSVQLILVAAISLAVVGAVVIALWLLGSASGGRDRFSTLEIVPQDAVFYVAINTDPSSSQWLAVSDVLDTLHAKDPIREAIDKALAEFGLEFERDILPLAGDEGYLAITDIDALADDEGGLVVAFQLRDGGRAKQIFLDIAEQEGTEYTEEVYEGETIYYAEGGFSGDPEDEGSLSVVGDVMVIGSVPDDVKGVIDVIEGRAPGAEGNERLQELRQRQEEDFLVWGYLDLTQALDAVEDLIEETAPEANSVFQSQRVFEQIRESTDRLSFSLGARRGAFVLDATVLQPAGADVPAGFAESFEPQLAERVPAETLAFFGGFDLYNATYTPFRDALEEASPADSGGQTFSDTLDDFEREIGIDLEDDLLSLMTGEYALAFNAANFDSTEPEFDVLALIGVNDRDKIEETMGNIDEFLEREDIARAEDGSRGGVHLWSLYEGPPEDIAWTVTNETLAVGYPESSVEGFLEGGRKSLAETADWKRTMDLFPDDKTSVLYISLARIIEEVRRIEGVEEEFEASTEGKVTLGDLEPIRTLAMASTKRDSGYGLRIVLLVEN